MIEKVRDAQTLNEMRGEINRLRRFDPVVRAAMDLADSNGASGEDRYTLLTYHLLKLNQVLSEMAMGQALPTAT